MIKGLSDERDDTGRKCSAFPPSLWLRLFAVIHGAFLSNNKQPQIAQMNVQNSLARAPTRADSERIWLPMSVYFLMNEKKSLLVGDF